MKQPLVNILFLVFTLSFITSCNVLKRVNENDQLLVQNTIVVDGKKEKSEDLNNLVYQQPNNKLLGIPLRLHIYNLARPERDSLFDAWLNENPKRKKRLEKRYSKKQVDKLKESSIGFNNWLKKTGEAPVVIDTTRTNRTKINLEKYYFKNGWFNREVTYSIDSVGKQRATITYNVERKTPYILDSISTKIASPVIDSLYQLNKSESILKNGDQFRDINYTNERERLTNIFRNSGAFYFSQDYITFENDTILPDKKVNVELQIANRIIRNEDSVAHVPFKLYKIKEVNIITDENVQNQGTTFSDSIVYKNYNLFSYDKMGYRSKAITDAIFINKNTYFSDLDRTRTYRYLNNLNTFKYPNIEYIENPNDTTLTANIILSPRKKYGLGFDINISQSNIQSIGLSFSTSLRIRNIFRGAETLEISGLGAIGASKDGSNNDDPFFDINEFGGDVKLIIPRFFFPFKTDKIIPKYMSPSTRITLGFTSQTNIGLDKQTVNGIFNYRWNPKPTLNHSLDLFNAQYVRNLNPANYFNVYQNSFNRLENIALNTYSTPSEFISIDNNGNESLIKSKSDEFINLVLQDNAFQSSNPNDYKTVNNIDERKKRLTEDNLILASNFSYILDKRESLFDKSFSIFRAKLELAGNLLANASNLIGLTKNSENRYEIFGVAFSQYVKTELDYVKHWSLGRNNEFATRAFVGIAIPYGNSNSIPFSRSFFAGGANDNRAWTAYNLGPGSSDSNNEFNEANLKLAFSLEHRYNLFGDLNGAFFVDIGNIWNVLDSEEDTKATFDNLKSLKDIAVGSGFGLRYDFGFFVLRGDIGFKTYDPSYGEQNRWFNDFNFKNAVYNIGINYPF
ncbi:MAG: BamA/TamA family outer membrane protein [Flavobacteriaceae bacterium]